MSVKILMGNNEIVSEYLQTTDLLAFVSTESILSLNIVYPIKNKRNR